MREQQFEAELARACTGVAKIALGGNASSDVIETVAHGFFECALTYRRRLDACDLDLSILVDAVGFIEESLVFGEIGNDVRWLDASLGAIFELLIPNRGVGPAGARLRKVAVPLVQFQRP